jgi:hypothetical protein
MTYFTYKLFAAGKLEPVSRFAGYRSVKWEVTALRGAIGSGHCYSVRMVFAGDVREA